MNTDVERLMRIRERFGDLLSSAPNARAKAIGGYQRYFQMCRERPVLNAARRELRRTKMREVLKGGHLREQSTAEDGWLVDSVWGFVPISALVTASKVEAVSCPINAGARNPDRTGEIGWCLPVNGVAYLACALLDVMDWEDRRGRSFGTEEEGKQLEEEWRAAHPRCSYVQHRQQVWYRPPPGSDHVDRLTELDLLGLQSVPRDDRQAFAWARLAALWDSATQDPILAEVSLPCELEPLSAMHLAFDQEAIEPFSERDDIGMPVLNPRKLPPAFAEDALRVVIEDSKARPKEPLSKRARLIYDRLVQLSPEEALTCSELLEGLPNISESAFYGPLIRELEPWGLRNRPRVGYYIKKE